MKRATLSNLQAIIIMALVLVVALWFVVPNLNQLYNSFFGFFGISRAEAGSLSEQQKTLGNAEQAFNSFIGAYQSCKAYSADACLCEQFDVNALPQGFSIKLESLSGEKTRFELYADKPTPEKASVIDNDNLCLYSYDKPTRTFSAISQKSIVLDSGNYPYKINSKIQLFRLDRKKTCLVSGTFETKEFDEATKIYQKCSLAGSAKTSKVGMLDLSDYREDYNPSRTFVESKDNEASKIIGNLRILLSDNVGKVSTTTGATASGQLRLERRQNMFSDAYRLFDSNKDGMINDDVYFISIRGLIVQSKHSDIKKDYFKIHYLQGSAQSKALADKISARLQELNGKIVYNDKEVSQAEAPAEYKFDFEILMEENTKDNIGPVFLACVGDYSSFPACKESILIPAVFVDVVEIKEDGHYMFEGHQPSIARKIYEGIRDYLG